MEKTHKLTPLILVLLLILPALSSANQYRLIRAVDGDTIKGDISAELAKLLILKTHSKDFFKALSAHKYTSKSLSESGISAIYLKFITFHKSFDTIFRS